jgi:hypothetical protein
MFHEKCFTERRLTVAPIVERFKMFHGYCFTAFVSFRPFSVHSAPVLAVVLRFGCVVYGVAFVLIGFFVGFFARCCSS